jgi:hypothetical protein
MTNLKSNQAEKAYFLTAMFKLAEPAFPEVLIP